MNDYYDNEENMTSSVDSEQEIKEVKDADQTI